MFSCLSGPLVKPYGVQLLFTVSLPLGSHMHRGWGKVECGVDAELGAGQVTDPQGACQGHTGHPTVLGGEEERGWRTADVRTEVRTEESGERLVLAQFAEAWGRPSLRASVAASVKWGEGDTSSNEPISEERE